MENTVYLVLEEYDYDGFSVESVHRSEANAIKEAEKLAVKSKLKKLGHNVWRRSGITISVEPFRVERLSMSAE